MGHLGKEVGREVGSLQRQARPPGSAAGALSLKREGAKLQRQASTFVPYLWASPQNLCAMGRSPKWTRRGPADARVRGMEPPYTVAVNHKVSETAGAQHGAAGDMSCLGSVQIRRLAYGGLSSDPAVLCSGFPFLSRLCLKQSVESHPLQSGEITRACF